MKIYNTLFLTIIIFFPHTCIAQSFQKDLVFVLNSLPQEGKINLKHEGPPSSNLKQQVSSTKFLFLGTIRIYQLLISSQDASVCNFTPSCSRFSVEAIRQAGPLVGLLLTSDRLQRDIGLPGIHRHYKFDSQVGKFLDPIDKYLGVQTR